jgi:hypothetical protein
MMAYNPNTSTVHLNLDTSNIIPIVLTYNFDYGQFTLPELQSRAKSTLGNFLGFVRQTFDGLLKVGRTLQEFYFDCLRECPQGKKVFEEWLYSQDFGSSRYIATSAMEIWAWFNKLPSKIQYLVRENVQKWSVSALRQLTKVSNDLVKELVQTGKKTAQQVKNSREGLNSRSKKVENTSKLALTSSPSHVLPPSPSLPPFQPGVRIIVMGEDTGLNGQRGIIISKSEDGIWVLLDCTVAQNMEIRHLFKPHQIQPEVQQPVSFKGYGQFFTAAQVEEKIAEALAQRDKEKAEEKQGLFIEMRHVAEQAVKRELVAAEQYAQKMAQAKQALLEQLAAKEEELQSMRALQIKNQILEQRVAELEQALSDASINNWNNTFTSLAAKVVNSDLEKIIPPLMSEVERLQHLVKSKEQELLELQTKNQEQQEELVILQQSSVQASENILGEFGEIGEQLGWAGWSRRGYRAASGMLHTGINAIAAFVTDLSSELSYEEEMTF